MLTDIDSAAIADRLAELCGDCPEFDGQPLHVIDEAGGNKAVSNWITIKRQVDPLVNNAGISELGPVADISLQQFRLQSAIRIHGVIGSRDANSSCNVPTSRVRPCKLMPRRKLSRAWAVTAQMICAGGSQATAQQAPAATAAAKEI